MAAPTRMNPIWDMEEQAKVRFKSMEKTASTAPSTMVTTPRASTTVFQGRSAQNRYREMISTPNTPLLVRMPLSSAEAGAGATGCALGSQMCSGNMPALAPKPTRQQPPATYSCVRRSAGSASASARSWLISRVPKRS